MVTTDRGSPDAGAAAAVIVAPPTTTPRPPTRHRAPLRPLATGSYEPTPAPAGPASAPGRALAYAVPMLTVAVLAVRWCRPGRFLAGGGTPPLLLDNLRTELWATWSHQLSGAGSSSYPMARLLDAAALAAGESFGVTAPTVQALLTAACAAYAAGAVALLARGFVRAPAAAVAGLLAVVNPVVLVTLPSRTPLLVAGTAAALAAAVRTAAEAPAPVPAQAPAHRRRRPPAGPDSPLVPAWTIGTPSARPLVLEARAASAAAALQPPVAAVVPVAPRRGLDALAVVVAVLPLSALAVRPLLPAALVLWTLAVAGAAVVAGGRGALRRLLRTAAWAVPLAGAASLWWLVPALLTWVRRGQGVALRPGGLVTADVLALLVPLVAVGVALLVEHRLEVSARLRRRGLRRFRAPLADAVTVAGVAAVLALPFPLWTGAVGERSAVAVPGGWEAVAAAVDGSPVAGKVLVLPLAGTDGRVDTAWGYDGADEVPRQLLRRPVLQRSTDPLFRLPDRVDDRLLAAERLLSPGAGAGARPDADRLGALLDQLGVSHVVVRRDLAADQPAALGAGAGRLPGWRPAGRYDVADVYERVRSAPLVDVRAVAADGTAPRLAWARHGAGHYEVRVATAPGEGGSFVLSLAEAYGPGWQVSGLPPSWTARHGVADGYANGWEIDGEGTATLHVRHVPSTIARYAAWVSLAAVGLAAVVTLVRHGHSARGADEPAGHP